MKRLLLVLGSLGLVLGFVAFVVYSVRAEPINLDSASANRTPTRLPYPPPDGNVPPRPPQRTLVIPTPRSPVTTTAKITREMAITQAMSTNSDFANLKARGQLTVTTSLTTYGEYSGRGNDTTHTRFHPSLPVWVVELETKPWTQWSGPVGNQVQLTFRGFRYVIDATTGEVLVSGSRILAEEKK